MEENSKATTQITFSISQNCIKRNNTKSRFFTESTDFKILLFFFFFFFFLIFEATKQSKHNWRLPVVNSLLFLVLSFRLPNWFLWFGWHISSSLSVFVLFPARNDKHRIRNAYWSQISSLIQFNIETLSINCKSDACTQWMDFWSKR